jgi:hypothetical protein
MGWREGDMPEGAPWPEDVVRATVMAYAKQHGQQSVWTGVAQLLARLDEDLAATIQAAAKQEEGRDATHRHHVKTIDELRHENLELRSQLTQ